MAREYASTITRPLCDADILDAYKQGIRDILKYYEEHVKGK